MKSCQRLKIDPLQLYGTNVVKCGDTREAHPEAKCLDHLRRSSHRRSQVIVVMGETRRWTLLNTAALPAGARIGQDLRAGPGLHAAGVEALVTPDIDASLDEQRLKAAFWRAFRRLGEWFDAIPPY